MAVEPTPITPRLRFEILRRDGHRCRYCGSSAPDVELAVDHVVPRALGGGNDPANLATACVSCNGGKASVAPDQAHVDDVSDQAARWAAALEQAALEDRDGRNDQSDIMTFFRDMWSHICGPRIALPDDVDATISTFVRLGLDESDLTYAFDAMQSGLRGNLGGDPFRYYCGVCWRIIKRREDRAAEILGDT